MADQAEFTRDLVAVLSKHGVAGLSKELTAKPAGTVGPDIGKAASYIREIITSDREFDEQVLSRVGTLLTQR